MKLGLKLWAMLVLTLVPLSRVSVAAEQPNILFIFCDDLTNQAISSLGDQHKLLETPNIDRLAAQGMKFSRCLVPNSICGPSRATILTGKYSHLNGFYCNESGRPFDGSQQTFPKLLQQAGYPTALIVPPSSRLYSNGLAEADTPTFGNRGNKQCG